MPRGSYLPTGVHGSPGHRQNALNSGQAAWTFPGSLAAGEGWQARRVPRRSGCRSGQREGRGISEANVPDCSGAGSTVSDSVGLEGPTRVTQRGPCGSGAGTQHLQKVLPGNPELELPGRFAGDLCIWPAERGKETLCPGNRERRAWDGHSSASRPGAQGPARAVTSTLTESSEKEKLSLFPW